MSCGWQEVSSSLQELPLNLLNLLFAAVHTSFCDNYYAFFVDMLCDN